MRNILAYTLILLVMLASALFGFHWWVTLLGTVGLFLCSRFWLSVDEYLLNEIAGGTGLAHLMNAAVAQGGATVFGIVIGALWGIRLA